MPNQELKKSYEFFAPKVFIRTFGCQMNVRDTEAVRGILQAQGYAWTDDPGGADVVLFNTCSVRQHAEEKVWSEIGRVRRQNGRPVIGVIGCMAQNHKQDIFRRAPQVDLVCGPSEIDDIALYLKEALNGRKGVIAVKERRRKEAMYRTGFREERDHAYVVISEGCDNHCSYCVVPYVRGRLRHRPASHILKETWEAVRAGITSVTLLGQNVNSYQQAARQPSPAIGSRSRVARKGDFVDLLKRVSDVKGLTSVSFITCHPKDTRPELFELMGERPNITKYLHMPFQSGSDRVLKAMNRGYTVRKYLTLVDRYRALVYNGKLSTDVIVGFPGETEADFEATRRVLEGVRFDTAYIFKYSPRPHTRAALLEDDVPAAVKKRRHAELLELQKRISREKKDAKTTAGSC